MYKMICEIKLYQMFIWLVAILYHSIYLCKQETAGILSMFQDFLSCFPLLKFMCHVMRLELPAGGVCNSNSEPLV